MEIKLTQKILKEIVHYNPKTGIFTWKTRDETLPGNKSFNTMFANKTAGAFVLSTNKSLSYVYLKIKGKSYKAHRLAFLYMQGKFPDNYVDHINNDSTDNRWVNLRDVTFAMNKRNIRKNKNNKSGVNGVHIEKNGRIYAAIRVNNKMMRLGYFPSIEEAAEARRNADIKYGFHPDHGKLKAS